MNTNLLRYYIAQAGMSCKDVENHLGLSHSAFSRKMNRKSEFDRSEIEKLVMLLGIKDIQAVFFEKEVS